jgi:hypothetical protein
MIYKLIAAALVVSSGEALKLNSVGMSRRTAVAKAATLALPLLVSMPASAELKRAQDAELYKVRATGHVDGSRARWTAMLHPVCCLVSSSFSPVLLAMLDVPSA